MTGGSDPLNGTGSGADPISYDDAIRKLFVQRRRRRLTRFLRRIIDPRPSSPGQVMLLGLAAVLVGWLVPVLHVLMVVGLGALALGFVSGMIQPRGRQVVWRNKNLDLPPEPRWTDRIYYLLYRRAEPR